jgi:anti-sigma B factor antagonist
MNLTTDRHDDLTIVRVGEARMMYPLLADFSTAVSALISDGARKVLVDLSRVEYIDSATIGCLMDLYRQISAVGGTLHLSSVQKRVETMLTMTGAQNFIQIHPDEARAVKSVGGSHAHD